MVFSTNGDVRTGPATQYTVTVKQVELCTSLACTTAHTLVTKTQDMDIASAAVGAAVGSYASTMTMPPMGVAYSHMRITVDRTFTITGYALSASSGQYCYTDGTAGVKTALTVGANTTSSSTAASSATASALELPNVSTTANHNEGGAGSQSVTITYGSNISLSGDDMLYIKPLTIPYTYYGQTPLIDISFGTASAVSSMEMGSGNTPGDCNLFPGEPAIVVTIN
ncbi:MAG: hypothetical protein HOF09_00985 [Candidatus Thioglobus sp.]|nr:hypothetical protein [Candidatus Thioglobus sp.]